jgi:hypothetical protein
VNKKLKLLDLMSNELTDIGIIALSESLKVNNTLQSVGLTAIFLF